RTRRRPSFAEGETAPKTAAGAGEGAPGTSRAAWSRELGTRARPTPKTPPRRKTCAPLFTLAVRLAGAGVSFAPGRRWARGARPRRRRSCGLQREACAERRAAAATEQRSQRRRHRDGRERPDRRTLRTLPARERGTFLALAQMRAQGCLVLPGQTSVELLRD